MRDDTINAKIRHNLYGDLENSKDRIVAVEDAMVKTVRAEIEGKTTTVEYYAAIFGFIDEDIEEAVKKHNDKTVVYGVFEPIMVGILGGGWVWE